MQVKNSILIVNNEINEKRKIMAKEKTVKTNAMRILEKEKIEYELHSYECNSFIDGQETADKLGLSEKQLKHVSNSEQGCGLILFDNVVIPFVDRYPKDTKTYAIMNTKPEEAVQKDEGNGNE